MSAIGKLMLARTEFHKRELKKSGWNDFAKFNYLDLSDFLLPAIEIFASLKLAALTSFTRELATMTITDLEDGSSVQITSPFGSAALKACHEVQNIGAVETYQRRYLWVAALEIVEHDAIDASSGNEEKEKSKVKPTISGEEFWNDAKKENGDEFKFLTKFLLDVQAMISFDEVEKAAKFYYGLGDQDEMLAVWSQMTSKERSAIKKFKPETVEAK